MTVPIIWQGALKDYHFKLQQCLKRTNTHINDPDTQPLQTQTIVPQAPMFFLYLIISHLNEIFYDIYRMKYSPQGMSVN